MDKRISITGINYEVKPLQEGEAHIFDGAGKIIVSAIKCLQENRFRVYAVCTDQVFDKTCFDLSGAVDYLQTIYNDHGRIM